MADTAKQLGVGLEAMQKWEYAAKQLGSETQYLDKAFQKVNTLLGQIANGDDVSEQLAKIGLTMDDLAGLDAEQAFAKIRSSIASVEDAATRTALANQFFGDKLGTLLKGVGMGPAGKGGDDQLFIPTKGKAEQIKRKDSNGT